MIRLWAVTAAIAAMLFYSPVQAGQCVSRQRIVHRQQFVQQRYVAPVFAQQIAYEPVYYQVGAGLREEAIATRAAEIAVEKFVAELQKQQGPGVGRPPDSGGANSMDTIAQGILTNHCARCHSGADPKGGYAMSSVANMGELERLKVAGKIDLGLMPENAAGEPAPLEDGPSNFMKKWANGVATIADVPGSPTP